MLKPPLPAPQRRVFYYAKQWAQARLGNPIDYLALDEALRQLDARRQRRDAWRWWWRSLFLLAWALVVAGLVYGAFWPWERLP